MRSEFYAIAALVALTLLASPAAAQPPSNTDPCALQFAGTTLTRQGHARIQIERDAAVYIIKHLQRSCRIIDDLVKETSVQADPRVTSATRVVVDKLRGNVLEYVYREYPDLRGQDLTSTESILSSRLAQMGPATAIYLRWALTDAETNFLSSVSKAAVGLDCRGPDKCTLMDIDAEIGFADAPIYKSFPDLWRLAMKEGEAVAAAQKRTPEVFASFRRSAPPRGSVRLTPAASSYIRQMLDELKRGGMTDCSVAAISWSLGGAYKGPNDTGWTKTGPGVSVGTYDCANVPQDVVQTIDGVRIVFGGDSASRFANKTIDLEGDHIVLKDR
jgi:hypothetical protein